MSTNENLEKKFGAKLAYIRKSKKLSQMKLAEKVDMIVQEPNTWAKVKQHESVKID